jgi:hypothetical protein
VDDGTTEEETAVKFDPSRSLGGRNNVKSWLSHVYLTRKVTGKVLPPLEVVSSGLILREGAAVLFFGG